MSGCLVGFVAGVATMVGLRRLARLLWPHDDSTLFPPGA